MKDYRKKQINNAYAMMASGLCLGIAGLIGDVPGSFDDAFLVTSYFSCLATGVNSIRLAVLDRRQNKLKGRG